MQKMISVEILPGIRESSSVYMSPVSIFCSAGLAVVISSSFFVVVVVEGFNFSFN
jgi:hypothetical protein